MNKYFYLGLSTASKAAALASALIVALGWNAKAFAYLIDSELWGTLAGIAVSVSAALLALIVPMAYRKKAWVMLTLASAALSGLMFGDAVLSIDAINITDEAAQIEAIDVENDPAVVAARERYELAKRAHERAQNILDPNGVANISNRNRERDYANKCWDEYQALRESRLAAAAMVRPDRPLTNYAGALLLILAYSVLMLVSDIPMAKYRIIARRENKVALKRAENARERIEGEKVINGWPHRIRSASDKDAAKELMYEYFVENGLQKGCIPADVTEAYKAHNINRTDIFNIRKEIENGGVNMRQSVNEFAMNGASKNGHANTIYS